MLHYAVIGDPIEHSLSPSIYRELFWLHGVEADFSKLLVPSDMLPSVRELTACFAGFAVTMPHKRSIMAYLDGIDAGAAACGAVNIVKRTADGLIGHNTDGDGLCDALAGLGFDPQGKSVCILGRGGAALSAARSLSAHGASVTLLVRTESPVTAFPQTVLHAYDGPCDLFINATPLGMKNEKSFDDIGLIKRLAPKLVFDMVYSTAGETELVRIARTLGIKASDGYPMLYCQALRAFNIWFDL